MTGGTSADAAERRRTACFAAAFFAITSLTIASTRFEGGLALVWPGTAILAALLLTLPRTRWPGALLIFAGLSAAATTLFGLGPPLAVPMAAVNVFEGWVVAALLVAVRPQRDWLEQVEGLAALILVAGVLGPLLAAGPGGFMVAARLGGTWLEHARDWAPAHGLGTLLAFPLASFAASGVLAEKAAGFSLARLGAFIGHGAAVAGVSALAFFQTTYPLLFLPVFPMLLAALRLGRVGASMAAIVVAGMAAASVQSGAGYFHALALPLGETALFVQFYLASLLVLALPLSVARKQHRVLLAELEDRKALKLLIADHSDDALLNLDENGFVRYASAAGERLSGEDGLVGKPLAVFFDPLDELLVRAALSQAAASPGQTRILERAVIRGDEQLWLEAKLRAVAPASAPGARGGALQGYAVTIRDVTQRKQGELDAIQAAETDPLTGLPNRRALLRQLERGLAHAEARPFAFAILDLDHFKRVNDSHGHLAGDAVLRDIAAVMRRMSSPSRYFARLGGEEFALIARQASFERSTQLCERLRAEIAGLGLRAPDGTPLPVTASIGIARIAHALAPAQALQAADALLYKAKNAGRDRVVATPAAAIAPLGARVAA